MTMKIGIPLTLTLSHQEAREKSTKDFIVPSPLMGEGEDEGGIKTHHCLLITRHGIFKLEKRTILSFSNNQG